MTTNYERAFAPHPLVYRSWDGLNSAIKEQMDPRRYELVTLAAAIQLKSSYCALAHGEVLVEQFGEPVVDIVRDPVGSGLDAAELAAMDLARKVVADASSVTEDDRSRLIDLGVPPHEVELVVMAAAARCFFSKSLDGLGVEPDERFADLDDALTEALVVGRPIAAPTA